MQFTGLLVTSSNRPMSRLLSLSGGTSLAALAALALSAVTGCGSDTRTATEPVTPVTTFQGVPGMPEGWGGSTGSQAAVGLTSMEKHGGASALYISGPPAGVSVATATPAVLIQGIRADAYRGKRVRFAAWAKPLGITQAAYAGLWFRVDGPGVQQAFDNMNSRPVTGEGGWREISIVVDVPQTAIGIALGNLYSAYGTLVLDDLRIEVVDATVPVTAPTSTPAPSADSLVYESTYERAARSPANLDFEGVAAVPAQTVAWLSQHAVPLQTTDPSAPLDDLEPLRQMIGSAHLVGLGEGTHGTREFFQMKHRILELLVTQMGFTHFAIEATTPEADDMNRYVLTGVGDPAKLLSRLYFWTWNTEEVLDMVRWMRQWNITAPAGQRVQFLGFDMQSPGASMDSVSAFLGAVDKAAQSDATSSYACIAPYRNRGPTPGSSTTSYATSSASVKSACAASLKAVYENIASRKPAYLAASSAERYAAALHAARLVQQYETMISATNAATSSRARDAAMAENVVWIREQAGPGARIALWAHNGHVNAVSSAMGGQLRASFGSDYVSLGLVFGRGSFSAVGQSGGTITGLGTWTVTSILKSSLESAFDATGRSRLLLDARTLAKGGADAAPLAGPIRMRSIGATFDQKLEAAYFGYQLLPDDFDLLIYLSATTATVRLPFHY